MNAELSKSALVLPERPSAVEVGQGFSPSPTTVSLEKKIPQPLLPGGSLLMSTPGSLPVSANDNTVLALNYGSSGAVDDVLNRLKQLRFSSTVLVDYSYLGQGVPVIANYSSQPGVDEDYDPTGNWRGTSTAYLRKENGVHLGYFDLAFRNRNRNLMSRIFDHEKLEVYRAALAFLGWLGQI
jgi:hypothetical protein